MSTYIIYSFITSTKDLNLEFLSIFSVRVLVLLNILNVHYLLEAKPVLHILKLCICLYLHTIHNYYTSLQKIFQLKYITWTTMDGNRPPDIPLCGFRGEKCLKIESGNWKT